MIGKVDTHAAAVLRVGAAAHQRALFHLVDDAAEHRLAHDDGGGDFAYLPAVFFIQVLQHPKVDVGKIQLAQYRVAQDLVQAKDNGRHLGRDVVVLRGVRHGRVVIGHAALYLLASAGGLVVGRAEDLS